MISIIAAMSRNRVIGKDGKIPWASQLPADLARFRKLTMGCPIIMGRKTHESIGKELKGRVNIVVSGNRDYSSPGCIIAHSLEQAIEEAKKRSPQVFIIGGESLYKQTLPLADELLVTCIEADFDGDTFFPEIDPEHWELAGEIEKFQPDQKNLFSYSFMVFRKKGRSRPVSPEFASSQNYHEVLEQILQSGECPFCGDNLFTYHKKPIIKRFGSWFITEATWPYENIQLHLLLISDEHKEEFSELTLDDFKSIKELVNWAIREFRIKGGALALRFGDSRFTGATVKHFHFHLIVPDDGKVVNFPIGWLKNKIPT